MSHSIAAVSAIAFAATLVVATSALADSRIFSASATSPGVTIDQALLNGQPLPVIGRGEGSTIFRIDSQIGPVPCANHVIFITSAGVRVDFDGDLCALNWQVAVDVSATNAPALQPVVPPSRVVTPPGGKESVTLATDDASVSITGVHIDHQPVAIVERNANTVRIEIESGPGGMTCQRDLGLDLSNGKSIVRGVNVCANGPIIVALAEPAAPPPGSPSQAVALPAPVSPSAPPSGAAEGTAAPQGAPPGGLENIAGAPPAGPGTPSPPTSPSPTIAVVTPDMIWSFTGTGDNAILNFGVPDSESSAFTATCQRNASQVTISLPPVVSGLKPGGAVSVSFSAGAFSKSYPAIGSAVSDETGESAPEIKVPASDPLWGAIVSEESLNVAVAPQPPFTISLKGSATPARQFLAACSAVPVPPPGMAIAAPPGVNPILPGPVIGPPGVPPGQFATGIVPSGDRFTVNYSCRDGSGLSVTYDRAMTTAYLAEPGAPPILLYRTAASTGAHFVAGPSKLVGRDESIRWSRLGGPPRICSPVLG